MLGDVNDGPRESQRGRGAGSAMPRVREPDSASPGGAGNFTPTTAEDIRQFAWWLRREGVEVAIRKSRGMDIAGCLWAATG